LTPHELSPQDLCGFNVLIDSIARCSYNWHIYISTSTVPPQPRLPSYLQTQPTPPPLILPNTLVPLDLIRRLPHIVPVHQSAVVLRCIIPYLAVICASYRGRCSIESTYFTKLSSSLLFALIGGVVGSSAFLPLVASTAPPMAVVRVAIASWGGRLYQHSYMVGDSDHFIW
jgi:hypothetical protein